MFDRCTGQLDGLDISGQQRGHLAQRVRARADEAAWDRTMAVNLKGPFLTCREAVRRWRAAQRGGRIVNVSSPAAFLGLDDRARRLRGLESRALQLHRVAGARGCADWGSTSTPWLPE